MYHPMDRRLSHANARPKKNIFSREKHVPFFYNTRAKRLDFHPYKHSTCGYTDIDFIRIYTEHASFFSPGPKQPKRDAGKDGNAFFARPRKISPSYVLFFAACNAWMNGFMNDYLLRSVQKSIRIEMQHDDYGAQSTFSLKKRMVKRHE